MTTKEQVLTLIFQAVPSFQNSKIWKEHLEFWGDTEERGLYNDTAELARYMAEQYKAGETKELPALFTLIEKLYLEGDHYVKELATIGFLEDLQGQFGNAEIKSEVLEKYLGPESQKWWNYLNNIWSGKLKEKYQWFHERVTEIVNALDPWYLISGGAPKDEYSQEVTRIIAGLKDCETEEDARQLVLKHLGGENSSKEACAKIAQQVFKIWEQILFSKE